MLGLYTALINRGCPMTPESKMNQPTLRDEINLIDIEDDIGLLNDPCDKYEHPSCPGHIQLIF